MPQTAVKEAICDLCGAEVRDGSLFCYNCGSSVTEKELQAEVETVEPVSNGTPPAIEEGQAATKPVRRDRPRRRPTQDREVVWIGREGISSGFVIMTAILVLLSAAILIAGFYFR